MNLYVSVMRTVVPLLVGYVGWLLARIGLDLDGEDLAAAVTVAVSSSYYTLFRLVEERAERAGVLWLRRVAGVLLGWARPPQYPRPDDQLAASLAPYRVRDR